MVEGIKKVLRKIPGYGIIKEEVKVKLGLFSAYDIWNVHDIAAVPSKTQKLRLNLLVTTLSNGAVFAGVQTAIDFFLELSKFIDADKRIIIVSAPLNAHDMCINSGFEITDGLAEREQNIVDLTNRSKPLAVRENDVFVATIWHSAYSMIALNDWYQNQYGRKLKLVYLIQDFEPGFSPWSTAFLLGEATYRMPIETVAVFNSYSLKEYFDKMGYSFLSSYAFTPKLNANLRKYLLSHASGIKRKKQILIYGRPNNPRNAFELIVMALDEWYAKDPNAKDWTILSAGYEMPDIKCPSGAKIHVLGKMSLEDYAKTMLETRVGVSLMVSPHPSYPPLEMAAFGVHVITNRFANKDLSSFSPNITSLERCTIPDVVSALMRLTAEEGEHTVMTKDDPYLDDSKVQWTAICEGIKRDLNL